MMREDVLGIVVLSVLVGLSSGCGTNDGGGSEGEQAGGSEWSRVVGESDSETGMAVEVDGEGSVYVAAEASFPIEREEMPYDGRPHVLVMKFGAQGGQLWSERFGAADHNGIDDVAVDGSGALYVVGSTGGQLGDQTHQGDFDAYVAKYGPEGEREWVRQFGGTSVDGAKSVAVTGEDAVLVAGSTYSDGVVGELEASDYLPYVAQYDTSGERQAIWSPEGFEASSEITDIEVGAESGVFLAGSTSSELGGESVSEDIPDPFVAKVDLEGNLAWADVLRGSVPGEHPRVVLDAQNRPYFVGQVVGGFADLDPIAEEEMSNVAVAGYEASGERRWTRLYGSEANDRPHEVAIDGEGRLRIVGYTQGTYGGVPPNEGRTGFVATVSPGGDSQSVVHIGEDGSEVFGAAAGPGGSLHVTGETRGPLGGQTFGGAVDAFVWKGVAVGE